MRGAKKGTNVCCRFAGLPNGASPRSVSPARIYCASPINTPNGSRPDTWARLVGRAPCQTRGSAPPESNGACPFPYSTAFHRSVHALHSIARAFIVYMHGGCSTRYVPRHQPAPTKRNAQKSIPCFARSTLSFLTPPPSPYFPSLSRLISPETPPPTCPPTVPYPALPSSPTFPPSPSPHSASTPSLSAFPFLPLSDSLLSLFRSSFFPIFFIYFSYLFHIFFISPSYLLHLHLPTSAFLVFLTFSILSLSQNL